MEFYRFDPLVDREKEQFGGVKAVVSKVLYLDDRAKVNAVYIHPNERVSHQYAQTQQLIMIVDGEGWVKSGKGEIYAIKKGQAAFWKINELHESGTETGMTAVIIEGIDIDPIELVPPLQEDKL